MFVEPHSVPEHGDVVIRDERRNGQSVYILRTVPGADQYLLPSHDEAITHATLFAEGQRVRVWLAESEVSYALVADFRYPLPRQATNIA